MFLALSALIASLPISACRPDEPTPPIPGYSLVWRDDFDGTDVDPHRWSAWALGPRRDAINTHDAAKLDGQGHLVLTTTAAAPPGGSANGQPNIHTGGLWTKGLFEPTLGYFEARIRFQSKPGHWGAFWLNCEGMGKTSGDPHASGVEMDIIEFHHKMKQADGMYRAQQTLHWDGYGKEHKSKGHTPIVQSLAEEFHTYGLLWTADEYVFFVDGVETWRVREKDGGAISHRAEYMILSLEVGDWAGKIDPASLPDSMRVDWVRVWQKPRQPSPATPNVR